MAMPTMTPGEVSALAVGDVTFRVDRDDLRGICRLAIEFDLDPAVEKSWAAGAKGDALELLTDLFGEDLGPKINAVKKLAAAVARDRVRIKVAENRSAELMTKIDAGVASGDDVQPLRVERRELADLVEQLSADVKKVERAADDARFALEMDARRIETELRQSGSAVPELADVVAELTQALEMFAPVAVKAYHTGRLGQPLDLHQVALAKLGAR